MYYGGMSNVPGAPGNFLAGGNFMGGQRTGPQLPMAMGMQGMIPLGNAGAFVDNSQFYMGPQSFQAATGFDRKIVS